MIERIIWALLTAVLSGFSYQATDDRDIYKNGVEVLREAIQGIEQPNQCKKEKESLNVCREALLLKFIGEQEDKSPITIEGFIHERTTGI